MADGDGTVSLLSLGAMCEEGWKRKRYNPGGGECSFRKRNNLGGPSELLVES